MLSLVKSKPYHYNDVRLFLVIIPFISAINYHLTYSNIQLNGRLVFTYLVDTQQGYVGWLCCRAVILYLDRIYPYSRNVFRRIVIQAIFSSAAGTGIIILQTMLMHYFFGRGTFPVTFFTLDVIIIAIWFLVANGIYVGLHFFTEWQNTEAIRKQEQEVRAEGFLVRMGKKNISVSFSDISGFTVDHEYSVLKTMDSKSYYLDESLETIEKKLPPELFCRLNRQYIMHRQVISGFERAENGKINVLIRPADHLPVSVNVSRLRAAAFKKWFQVD